MNINPSLTAAQNILALVNDPELGQPVNPNDLGVAAPQPYNPQENGPVYGSGLNIDGENSNTQVIVYQRPTLDDVLDDGQSQRVIYQRQTLEQAVGSAPLHVTLPPNPSAAKTMSIVAAQLGLVESELYFPSAFVGEPVSFPINALVLSLLYLPSTLTITASYTS
jgi:hypothetical protein